MKLQIDNLDGAGTRDYTSVIDGTISARIVRQLNRASQLLVSLVADGPAFVAPVSGARVMLDRDSGEHVFTGYLTKAPEFEYLGPGERGALYRYNLISGGDEELLDRKRLSNRPAFVDRGAGDVLRQLTENLLPGVFDESALQDVDGLAFYSGDPQKKWSDHAAEIAVQARASYRALNGALAFSPVGAIVYALDEAAADFSPDGLRLQNVDGVLNDLTIVGRVEPQDYVKDYFVGDGFSMRFYMSQIPFTRRSHTVLDEEFKGTSLDPTRWSAVDPASVVSVSGGKLQIAGGTGVDGQTAVMFGEKIELGGAFVLQHGDVLFSAASDGMLGGLYAGSVTTAGCLAGFRITPNGTESKIQAAVSGALTGAVINTTAGHHYVFSTRIYAMQIYRKEQTFHSSLHPARSGRGGGTIAADVRLVLEVHDIDPADPGSMVAPSIVLYDGVIAGAPDFCAYALVDAIGLHCTIAFTRLTQAIDAEVRSALPGSAYRTRLAGSLSEGAECLITGDPALQFFPQYVPAANELIEVHYRGLGRALARVIDPDSIAAHQNGSDDGVRGAVRNVQSPAPRTAVDCENSALAMLDDATGPGWSGNYTAWSDFLPGAAEDIFPGDALDVNAPSRGAAFRGFVRKVEIEIRDLQGRHSVFSIHFADELAAPLGFEFQAGRVSSIDVTVVNPAQVGATFLADLTGAVITAVTSTTVSLDSGVSPASGGGIEVRWSDFGWNQDNDRNLVGRFTSQTFTVPRLSRVQNYYLRQYDSSTPAKYSRYSAALHLDYPL